MSDKILRTPQEFDFEKTAYMLQRGNDDPINIIGNNEWRRCFYFENTAHLISTKYDKKLYIDVLSGDISNKTARDIIEYTLGFDDPFLTTHVNALPYAEKLQGAIGLNIPGYPDLFEAIIQVIMGQQISVVVANKVRARFTVHLGDCVSYENINYYSFPQPLQVIKQSVENLRALGLSNNKCKSILAVANAFIENEDVLNFNLKSDPEHVRKVLTSLYGVGNWTVDWLLMRHFRRFEFIPEGDIAVQKAFTWWLNKSKLMSATSVKQFEKEFYPFGGSVAFRVLYAYSSNIKRQSD
ncbi:MAG: hypothetical protein K2Y14_03125 [Burkholderiales bacterium]|nr:hypothetical protein [Burkholderiales bacterium]